MIYITGDTHGIYERFAEIEKTAELKKNDFLIICGDFGFIETCKASIHYYPSQEEYILKLIDKENAVLDELAKKEYNILFIDGNHEGFPQINNEYPLEEWNGGKIHRIRPNIIHLMRGQVFEIEGLSFFTFGGAYSTDTWRRTINFSYWDKAEIPSEEEMKEGSENLKKREYKVNYVITHTLPESTARLLGYDTDETKPDSAFMKYLDEEVRIPLEQKYNEWFVGLYHRDTFANYSDKIRLLYESVVGIYK